MLINNGIVTSKREAREFISAGSIIVNGDKATDENMLITKEVSIDNTYVIVRRGKKKYYVGIIK